MKKILLIFLFFLYAFQGQASAANVSFNTPGYANVDSYGAIGNGSTDDSAAIQAAATALGAAGGTVCLTPGKTYAIGSTLSQGNGTTTTASTINGIVFDACGSGGSQASPHLKWIGASNGTMIQNNGLSYGNGIKNLYLDANSLAATAIHQTHNSYGNYENLYITNWTGIVVINDTQCPSTYANGVGNAWNKWDNVLAIGPASTSAKGFDFEGCTTSSNDTTQNIFSRVLVGYGTGSTSYGFKFAFADNNHFYDVGTINSSNTGDQIVFAQQSGGFTQFPYGNNFYDFGFDPAGVSGTSGTGGNAFLTYNTAAGGSFPSITNITGTPISNPGGGPSLPLSVANGGTGTASPGLVAGTNVTITGSWPNQTISTSGGGSSPLVEIGSATASNSSSIVFTSVPASYDEYWVGYRNLVPSTAGAVAQLQLSEDNGSTFITSGYAWSGQATDTSSGSGTATGTTYIPLSVGSTLSNSSNIGISGHIILYSLGTSGVQKEFKCEGTGLQNDGTTVRTNSGGRYTADTNVVNAFRIIMSSGTFSGKISLFGLNY